MRYTLSEIKKQIACGESQTHQDAPEAEPIDEAFWEQFKAKAGFSESEIKWVYHNALTPAEREKVKEVAASAQLNLLEPPNYEWDEVMSSIDEELIRLGWTVEQARNYLQKTYGVKSRYQLDDEQILELWQTLKTW